MLLTGLVWLSALKWAVPMATIFASAPVFITVWTTWRVLTLALPTHVYRYGDDMLYSLYQRMIIFFMEHYSGVTVCLYGDIEQLLKEVENVLYISNHQSAVDWVITDFLAIRQGALGFIRYMLKDGLQFLPLYGFYFKQHGCVYVNRSGKMNMNATEKQIQYFKRHNLPLWFVVFPEGTRYSILNTDVIEKSKRFATEQGVEVLHHVLTPRPRGVRMSLDQLKGHLSAVYDVTIAYSGTQDTKTGERLTSPGLTDMVAGDIKEIHVNVHRIAIADVPMDEEEQRKWLHEVFIRKDKLLSSFYSPDDRVAGRFPGDIIHNHLSMIQTLPAALFLTSVTVVTICTVFGRALYWKVLLAGTIGGIIWTRIKS